MDMHRSYGNEVWNKASSHERDPINMNITVESTKREVPAYPHTRGLVASASKYNSPRRRSSTHKTHNDNPKSAKLSWRLDPVESLSDWTLVVVSNENAGESQPQNELQNSDILVNDTIDDGNHSIISNLSGANNNDHQSVEMRATNVTPAKRYYVHRAVLGVGPKKGDFFADLFQKQRIAIEMSQQSDYNNQRGHDVNKGRDLEPITYIEVKPSAAAAFDTMLDFMYAPNDTPAKTTTESAVALRHLSIALGIRELFNSVTPFIQKDLSAQTSPIYLFEAHRYKHEKLLNVALKICASHFSEIKLSLIILLPPKLLHEVLKSPHLKFDSSEQLSSRIASYFRCRPKVINRENLLDFTSADIMPNIAHDEVIFYINLMERTGLLLKRNDWGKFPSSKSSSSLYERCIQGSSKAIYHIMDLKLRNGFDAKVANNVQQKRAYESEYEAIASRVKVKLLEKALLEKMSSHSMHSSNDQIERRDADVTRKGRRKRRDKDDYRRMKEEYKEQLSILEEKLAQKEQTIQRYESELSKFTRVPNEYRPPPIVSDHTYRRDPRFDEYGESLYGYIPPTALPRIGHSVSDGWIYREERINGGKKHDALWPMYYYKAN